MFPAPLCFGEIEVRLAQCPAEVMAIQQLRYQVFYEEGSALPSRPEIMAEKRDFDALDEFCHHLIATDTHTRTIVGGYRLISSQAAKASGGFLSATEFDLSTIDSHPKPILELGRACVARAYRQKGIISFLWKAIAAYVQYYDIGLLFGCASFPGIDPEPITQALSFLYHFYLVNEKYRPRALPHSFLDMNRLPKDQVNVSVAFRSLPPLIKGYLQLGGMVGDGAFIDHVFHSLDVCVVFEIEQVTARYLKRYGEHRST